MVLTNAFITVAVDEIVAVEQFGEFKEIKGPGLHILGFDVFGAVWQTKSVTARITENQVRR